MSRLDDIVDVAARHVTATTLVRSRLETCTHCKAFLMTEEILSYTYPVRTPRCRERCFVSGDAEAKDHTRKRDIINDRDGVSLALNSSGLHETTIREMEKDIPMKPLCTFESISKFAHVSQTFSKCKCKFFLQKNLNSQATEYLRNLILYEKIRKNILPE